MEYVWFFLAGALAANGVPHFIKGILGEQHHTPFGNSTPATNVAWGVANFTVAWLLWRYALNNASHVYRYHLALALGVLAMGLILARRRKA